MRGKDLHKTRYIRAMRITPACAGKRDISVIRFYVMKDHPRVCGEKEIPVWVGDCDLGSPPRVRGKD